MTAIDSDLGSNGDLTYSLTDSDGTPATEWFTIEEGSGVIRLKQSVSSHGKLLYPIFMRDYLFYFNHLVIVAIMHSIKSFQRQFVKYVNDDILSLHFIL